MGEFILGAIVAAILGYLSLMTFVMGAMSSGRRWPSFLLSAVFAAGIVALFWLAWTHYDVEVRRA